jgi:hypothetical protein
MLQACEYCVIGGHRDAPRGVTFIDGNEDVLRRVGRDKRAGKDEDIVIGMKDLLVSGLECWMKAAERKQVLECGERLLLLRSAAGRTEGIGLRCCEAAREIAPVVGIFSALHGDLIARVDAAFRAWS